MRGYLTIYFIHFAYSIQLTLSAFLFSAKFCPPPGHYTQDPLGQGLFKF